MKRGTTAATNDYVRERTRYPDAQDIAHIHLRYLFPSLTKFSQWQSGTLILRLAVQL